MARHDEEGVVDAHPSPMRSVSSGEIDGMPSTWLNRPMIPMAVPGRGAPRGSGGGGEERADTRRSTIMAAARQTVLLRTGCWPVPASGPVTATVQPAARCLGHGVDELLASAFEMFWSGLSKLTWKNPTVSSFADVRLSVEFMRFPLWSNGLVTGVNVRERIDLSTMVLMRWRWRVGQPWPSPECRRPPAPGRPSVRAPRTSQVIGVEGWVWGKLKLFE